MFYVRPPVYAGRFYDLEPDRLKMQIEGCFNHSLGPKEKESKGESQSEKLVAVVAPHAGYMASGPVHAWAISRLPKANYIIVGPNHSGFGSQFAIMKKGLWKTPLGGVAVSEKVADRIEAACELVEHDVLPHQSENSIEVQLPFLQYRFGNDFGFVPLCVLQDPPDDAFLESCRVVGEAIAGTVKALKKDGERWILIASSDFSHYIPQKRAVEIDKKVIGAISKLDEKMFFHRVKDLQASVCGYGPIAMVMIAAKALGAKKAELLKYATSGDTTGDTTAVVGYASIAMM